MTKVAKIATAVLPKSDTKPMRHLLKVILFITHVALLVTLWHTGPLHTTRKKRDEVATATPGASPKDVRQVVRPYSLLTEIRRDIVVTDYANVTHMGAEQRDLFDLFIADYLRFHAAHRRNGSRVLIFRPARAGMGDTFGRLCYAYWVAVVSRRVLLVDWHEPFTIEGLVESVDTRTDMFFRDGVDAPENVPSAHIVTGENGIHNKLIGLLESTTTTVVMSTKTLPPVSVLETLAQRRFRATRSVRTIVNFMSSIEFRRAILYHVLHLSAAIRRDHVHFASRRDLAANGQGRPYIAVHARIGKGVNERSGRFVRTSGDEGAAAARCLAARAVALSVLLAGGSELLPVFLATDTPAFRMVFSEAVRAASGGRTQVVSGDWAVMHSTKLAQRRQLDAAKAEKTAQKVQKVQKAQTGDEDWAVVWGGYMDLVMLGHAEHIVALYSSFPRLALALGNAHSLTELRNDLCYAEKSG